MGKGFPLYKYIDEHLDFNRFSFTFVGRSPCAFRNIVHVPPQTTPELAKLLAAHDVFLSASRYEACSNSVLEAMHCGLPAVVFNDSSNPEIIGAGGRAFDSENDVIGAIEEVAAHLEEYRRKVDLPGIDEVGDRYWKFCRQIWTESREGAYAIVQRNAMKVWESDGQLSLLELLKQDPEVTAALGAGDLEEKFDLDYHFAQVDRIFARVFP